MGGASSGRTSKMRLRFVSGRAVLASRTPAGVLEELLVDVPVPHSGRGMRSRDRRHHLGGDDDDSHGSPPPILVGRPWADRDAAFRRVLQDVDLVRERAWETSKTSSGLERAVGPWHHRVHATPRLSPCVLRKWGNSPTLPRLQRPVSTPRAGRPSGRPLARRRQRRAVKAGRRSTRRARGTKAMPIGGRPPARYAQKSASSRAGAGRPDARRCPRSRGRYATARARASAI